MYELPDVNRDLVPKATATLEGLGASEKQITAAELFRCLRIPRCQARRCLSSPGHGGWFQRMGFPKIVLTPDKCRKGILAQLAAVYAWPN
jgi:hypothetical protein